jgi:uncharacterized OB-fold protein
VTTLRTRLPAVEGWFRMDDDDPRLLGSRCTTCGTYFFPRESSFCRNPTCEGTTFEEAALSRGGRLWSWTTNHYAPPPPYVAAEPFEPYTIAAVELEDEHIVILGQVEAGTDPGMLRTGAPMELTLATLFSDDAHDYVVWKWRPVSTTPSGAAS